jgi:23S rRNA (adenine2503-C2)-methyltransferase
MDVRLSGGWGNLPMADVMPDREQVPFLSLTSDQAGALARERLGIGADRVQRTWRTACREGRFAPEEAELGERACAAMRGLFSLQLPTVVRHAAEDGPQGPTAKLVIRLHDGLEVEAVAFPVGESLALCISSQVGCKMGCTFCETGRMGLLRNLQPEEIVAQVLLASQVLGRRPDRVVYMGMGEALDNADHVIQSLHILADRRGFSYSQERLTVCTAGHAAGLRRLGQEGFQRLGIGVSLNAANDALRSQLMPVNRRTPLAELQSLLIEHRATRTWKNFPYSINYCLLPGLNDRREHAGEVAAFCRPLGRCLVSLIPYNPGNAPLTRAPTDEETDQFIAWLREDGVGVRRRITKGRSIMAACGQLGNVALRRAR